MVIIKVDTDARAAVPFTHADVHIQSIFDESESKDNRDTVEGVFSINMCSNVGSFPLIKTTIKDDSEVRREGVLIFPPQKISNLHTATLGCARQSNPGKSRGPCLSERVCVCAGYVSGGKHLKRHTKYRAGQ